MKMHISRFNNTESQSKITRFFIFTNANTAKQPAKLRTFQRNVAIFLSDFQKGGRLGCRTAELTLRNVRFKPLLLQQTQQGPLDVHILCCGAVLFSKIQIHKTKARFYLQNNISTWTWAWRQWGPAACRLPLADMPPTIAT
jgi:hypothetical protein